MKGHGLNYPEANSSKESLSENQPSICSTLQPTWTLVQERENTGGLAITEAHGAFCTWHNQDQVHPKMKQWQAGESFTPCLWQFLFKCRVSRVLCESGLFFCVRYAIVFALSFYPPLSISASPGHHINVDSNSPSYSHEVEKNLSGQESVVQQSHILGVRWGENYVC